MDFARLYHQHQDQLEDFWGRRTNEPVFQREFTLFDRVIRLLSNDEGVIAAADHAIPLYSTAPPANQPPLTIHLIVRPAPQSPGPPPEDLLSLIRYTGYGDWLSLHIGPWGHCQINPRAGEAIAVLDPTLAQRPDLVSRGLLNTIFTNFFIGLGYGMLHCTGLWRQGRALLLMAPHNSGKSTTAFRLVLAGNQLISDSQIYVSPYQEQLQLMGFPVGRVKLRQDMVPLFPEIHHLLTPEPVRQETKQIFDLRQWQPELAITKAVHPEVITLCLLRRSGQRETRVEPAPLATVWEAVMANSIFYDTAAAWQHNLQQAKRLIAAASHYHLVIGTEPTGIIAAVERLWAEG
ncbi:MAG: hypothetical protein V9G20_15350 [Candidatus Promineifilaceae bacterium]